MGRKKRIPKLGELELAVLERLWTVGDADVLEAHAAVGARRGISPNTVGSALERLYRKKLVTRRKVSHAYRYRPAVSREDFQANRLIEAAGGLRELSNAGLLAAFVNLVADADMDALGKLERLVRRKRRGAE